MTLNGQVSPAHDRVEVTLTYTGPDASAVIRTVAIDASGKYSDAYQPDRVGSWTVRASWPGDADHTGAESNVVSLTVTKAT